jgi:hypothetical protein
MKNSLLTSILCVGALSSGSSAFAAIQAIPPAEWSQGVSEVLAADGGGPNYGWISNPVTGPGTVTTPASGGTFDNAPGNWSASSTVSATLTPSPSLSAAASVFGTNFYPEAKSGLTLKYYIEVLGPAGLVPLTVQASGWANSGGLNAAAAASLGLSGLPLVSPVFVATSQAGQGSGLKYFTVNNTYDAAANSVIGVRLSVSADAETYSQLGVKNSASAYVDPVFSVPDGYTLLFSEGVGNEAFSAPSPVPGSGWLSLALLVIVGAAAKARAGFAS